MKRELIKNGFIVGIIVLFACIATHTIYYRFHEKSSVDYSSKSLEVVFHEEDGNKITLDKAVPLTDNLGLASNSYTFTVTNNLTEDVPIKIKLVKDKIAYEEDKCKEIPEKFLKVSIKENGKKNVMHLVTELEDEVVLNTNIKALKQNNYTVRIWTTQDFDSTDNNLHYHGELQVVENDNILALNGR